MWVEEDGDQEVKMHFRGFKDAFLEILTDERIGAVDLFSQPRFDAQGRRWFTANANSGEWFEEAQAEVGPDTGVGAGLAFFDGAHILQNVGVNAAYVCPSICDAHHFTFSPQIPLAAGSLNTTPHSKFRALSWRLSFPNLIATLQRIQGR